MSSFNRLYESLNGAIAEGRIPDVIARWVPRDLLKKARERSPHFFQGLWIAILTMKDAFPDVSALKNINLGGLSSFFVSHSLSTLLVMGIGLGILFTILAPVTFALLFLAPGMLGQVIVTLAKIATYFAGELDPNSSAKVFLDSIAKADPTFGNALRNRYNRSSRQHLASLPSRLLGRLFKVGHFLKRDWKSWAIGFIPIVGPVAGFATTSFASSEDLMQEVLLQPYADAEGWSDERKNAFFKAHKSSLIGYAFPFAFLVNIPIVGAWALQTALTGMGSHVIPTFTSPEHRRRLSAGGVAEGKIGSAAAGIGSESDKDELKGSKKASGKSASSTGVDEGSSASSSQAHLRPSAPKLSPTARDTSGRTSPKGSPLHNSPRRNFVTAT